MKNIKEIPNELISLKEELKPIFNSD